MVSGVAGPMKKTLLLAGCGLATMLFAQSPLRSENRSPIDESKWRWQKEIFVPMRDGINLSTDVILPRANSGPFGTILIRTPYDKDNIEWKELGSWYQTFLDAGYAVVLQNERGRQFSEGSYKTYLAGADTDGYDSVAWIAKQPWSNGKVGAVGCSSSGEQQWPMANSKPPALAAMVPGASGTAIGGIPGNDTQGFAFRGGIPQFALGAAWYHDMATTERLVLPAGSSEEQRVRLRNSFSLMPKPWFYEEESDKMIDLDHEKTVNRLLAQLPAKDVLRRLGGAMTPFDDYITWAPKDARWQSVPLVREGFSTRTPTLFVNTWHDVGAGEMTRLFKLVQDQKTENQFLIMGSGPHCSFAMSPDSKLADLKFGNLEVGDVRYHGENGGYDRLFLKWFDHFLMDKSNSVTAMSKVQLHIMGKGWIFGDRWPLETTRFTTYYLDSTSGPGMKPVAVLSTSPPTGRPRDTFVYDPGSPVPTRGGSCCGDDVAVDQRDVEARADVLSYTTPALRMAVTVAGPVEVVLYVSSSAKDTDFTVKLVDVYPDGKAINLADDGFRVRYREGFDKKVLMDKGQVYEIRLTNMVTGNYFPIGHQIRLDVSSSNFPAYERNLNTGGNNFDETKWVIAENSVHHATKSPSHIILPIVPN
jgi:uncharacterized protein